MSQCETAIKQWIWKYNCNGWKYTSDKMILHSGHKILSLSSSCLMRNFHEATTLCTKQCHICHSTLLELFCSQTGKSGSYGYLQFCEHVPFWSLRVIPIFHIQCKRISGHACPLEWNEFRCVYITLWVLDRAVWLPAAILQWILSAVAHCASTGYKMGGTRKESSVNVMLAPAYVIYPHHVASIQVLFALAIIHRSRSSVKIFNVKAYKYSWEWSWVDVGSVGSNQITY